MTETASAREQVPLAGYDRATWHLASFIDDWLYAIRGSLERKDHRQAFQRIGHLRKHLHNAPPDRRRAALELYRKRKDTGNG